MVTGSQQLVRGSGRLRAGLWRGGWCKHASGTEAARRLGGSEHDFKCIMAARNRPMLVCKMIGAVYRSWYNNVDSLKKLWFGKDKDQALTDDERALMAANVQVLDHGTPFCLSISARKNAIA